MQESPTDKDIVKVQNAANDCLGLKLTKEQALNVFDDASFSSDYERFGMDTETREKTLANYFALRFTGKRWPLYGDGREKYEDFIARFNQAASEAGYEVIH